MKHHLIILIALILLMNTSGYSQTANKEIEFKTYSNTNRQFKIDYPSYLAIGDPAQNDNGRSFTSDKGEIYLAVTSSYNMDQSISELYTEFLTDKVYRITYKVLKANWYVVSGFNENSGKEFYQKVYFSDIEGQGGQIRSLYLEYPKSKHSDFDKIIPKMVKSFKDI